MNKYDLLISKTTEYLENLFNTKFCDKHSTLKLHGYSSTAKIAFIVLQEDDRNYAKNYNNASRCTTRDKKRFQILDEQGIALLFIHYEIKLDDLHTHINNQLDWYKNR